MPRHKGHTWRQHWSAKTYIEILRFIPNQCLWVAGGMAYFLATFNVHALICVKHSQEIGSTNKVYFWTMQINAIKATFGPLCLSRINLSLRRLIFMYLYGRGYLVNGDRASIHL